MNKKYFFSGIALVLAMWLTGCSRNTPKEVAKVWLTSFNRMDTDPAMKLSTGPTRNLLSTLTELTGGISDSARKELDKVTVDIKNVEETGDKAVVSYTTSDNPRERKLNLIKENDKWLVQFSKSDLANEVMHVDEPQEIAPEAPATDSTATDTTVHN